MAGAVGLTLLGWYRLLDDIEERKCVCWRREMEGGGAGLFVPVRIPPLPPAPCHRRSYYNLSRFNERFERGYVLQAREDASWARRHAEYLDRERELMAGVPGWTVHKSRFYTQPEGKPDIDTLDPRFAVTSHW